MTPEDSEPPPEADSAAHPRRTSDRQVRWVLVATAILTSLAVLIFLGYVCSLKNRIE